jgi:hypothetical protein
MGMWQPRTSVTGMAGMLVMVSPTELQGGGASSGRPFPAAASTSSGSARLMVPGAHARSAAASAVPYFPRPLWRIAFDYSMAVIAYPSPRASASSSMSSATRS